MANPYVNKVIVNGTAKLDLTGDTVSADKLVSGYTAHDATGALITGTFVPSAANLSVVAYASSFPSSASENTIGVITTTPISSWSMQQSAPSNPTSGHVWIKVGSKGPVQLKVTVTEQIWITPVSAYQWNGSAWIICVVKSYNNGRWTSWAKELYTNGTENVEWSYSGSNYGGKESSYFRVGRENAMSTRSSFWTTSMIDVTDFSTLYIEYYRDSGDKDSGLTFGLSSAHTVATMDVSAKGTSKTMVIASCDISSVSGLRYVTLSNTSTSNVKKEQYVFRVWLEG